MWHFGLKDKNDKEIYELDIVKVANLNFPEDESIIDVAEWGLNCDDYYPAFDLRNFSYQVEMNSFLYIFNSGLEKLTNDFYATEVREMKYGLESDELTNEFINLLHYLNKSV